MVRWMRTSFLMVAWAIGAAGAQAQVQAQPIQPRLVHDCRLSDRHGLLPQRIFLLEMPAPGQVDVWDGAVKATVGQPMPATVVEDTPQTLRLKWEVRGLRATTTRGSGTQIDVIYNAVYQRGGALTMTAEILGGYENPLAQGTGSCTPG